MFRAALRLYTNAVPAKKYEVLPAIAQHVSGVDQEAFELVRKMKEGKLKPSQVNVLQVFDRVMQSLQALGNAVDGQGRTH